MTDRPTYRITMRPIDPMLFGDNRLSRPAIGIHTGSREPTPLMFYGAVGGWILASTGGSFQHWPDDLLGPQDSADLANPDMSQLKSLAYVDPGGNVWFPKPLSLRVEKQQQTAFGWVPTPTQAWSSLPSGLLALNGQMPHEEDQAATFIDISTLESFLIRHPSGSFSFRGKHQDEFVVAEHRVNAGINSSRNTAEEGRLFNRPYRRFRVETPAGKPPTPWGYELHWQPRRALCEEEIKRLSVIAFLGGDRGRVEIQLQLGDTKPFRRILDKVCGRAQDSTGFFLYLFTPAVLPENIGGLVGHPLVGCAVGKPLYVSGWDDINRQPRSLFVAAPAGSVFFFHWTQNEDRRSFITKNWLGSLSRVYSSAGFGRYMVGVWHDPS